MPLEVTAFLADSADTVNGKIYALGIGWDLLVAPGFPFVFPRVALGIMVHVEWTDTEVQHELRVHLETEDGVAVPLGPTGGGDDGQQPMLAWATRFQAQRPPLLIPGTPQLVPFSVNVNNAVFPVPGGYSWVIEVDGEVASRLPLRVAVQEPV
ncbi:DUF6941 family protein [Frondihabitans cladoniiphilus]|uniref:Uncharacterized protein n=1 Tax=Frondihabitans cladoniiphilus TaxID=715785 RepID=A0ABP8VJT5_9MICO